MQLKAHIDEIKPGMNAPGEVREYSVCKICKTKPVQIHGGYCEDCILAHQEGERAATRHIVNLVREKLLALNRDLEALTR